MHATARRTADLSGQRADEPTLEVNQPRSDHAPIAGDSYADDRRKRLRRGRLAGFALCIPLWVLGAVPLAREVTDGRAGTDLLVAFLAVGVLSLAVAAAVRGVYVLLTRRRFWSPWLFPFAAFVAIAGYTVQSAGEQVPVEGALVGVLGDVADQVRDAARD